MEITPEQFQLMRQTLALSVEGMTKASEQVTKLLASHKTLRESLEQANRTNEELIKFIEDHQLAVPVQFREPQA